MAPASLETRAARWTRAHAPQKTFCATGECETCRARPEPGTAFEQTACAVCTFADSIAGGHGRGVSFDELSPVLADDGNPAAAALRRLTESEQADPDGHELADDARDGDESDPQRERLADMLRAIIYENFESGAFAGDVPEPVWRFGRKWMSLSPACREVVRGRLSGSSFRELRGCHTLQAAHFNLKTALLRCPELANVPCLKVGRPMKGQPT